jgi:Pyruvate/2-oxoacid:ferredoxin oxidoreductase delta subunit
MPVRNIIRIDEEKCDGCGLCVIGCAEGALQVIDGKAKLISDIYCDGLGACLEECPQGALIIEQREAPEFDEKAVEKHLAGHTADQAEPAPLACGCPGSMVTELKPMERAAQPADIPSALGHWPIQLHLAPVEAPFFKNANLLIAATCSGFSIPGLHRDFLPGKALTIACPKLDHTDPYEDKLAEIIRKNDLKDITVLYMTVPCCFGLVHLVKSAIAKSGKDVPLRLVKVDPSGEVVEDVYSQAA